MFKFANPEYLYLLILLPVMVAVYLFSGIRRRRNLKLYGEPELLARLMPEVSGFRPSLKFWLTATAFAFSCIVLARPQFGTKQETVTRSGIETIIALDVSNSMLADDVAPSRLAKSKRIISNLVDQMKDDKIGMIVFAGDAFVQLPITSDFISAKVFLSSISPQLVARQGTDIKAAIDLAMRSFTPNEGVGKAIIVITDGENHEGGAVEAAKAAAEKGYVVHVMGVGSTSGSPIPGERNGEFRKDKDGNVIVTRMNEQMCQEIAQAGSGSYFYVDNSNAAEKALQKELDKLAKSDVETTIFTEFDEQFRVFAWIVLILLAIDLAISESRNPRLRNISLFKMILVLLALVPVGASAQRTDREYVRKGNHAFADSSYVKAEENYLRAIDQNSSSVEATYNLGNAYLHQQKAQEAAEQYQKTITLQELKQRELISSGASEKELKECKEKTAMAYHNLGVMFQASEDYQKAVSAYQQALRNNPADQETRYNMILAMEQLKKQQQQEQEQDQNGQQDKEDQQQEQDQNQQNDQQQEQQQQPQQQQNQDMSKENAEQLLKAAMQDEQDVQERVQQKMQVQPKKKLDKDW